MPDQSLLRLAGNMWHRLRPCCAPESMRRLQRAHICHVLSLLASALPALSSAAGAASPATQPEQQLLTPGGTTPRALASRFAEVINVKDFGARCDGDPTGDDATAINAAIASARHRFRDSTLDSVTIEFPRNSKPCVVKSTINLTGFDHFRRHLTINGNGTPLLGVLRDKPVVDALGSHRMVWNDVSITAQLGDAVPSYGLIIGATDNGNGGSINTFSNLTISGYFSVSAFYNFGGEQNTYINPTFQNFQPTGQTYAAIFDGFNHFNVSSAFVRQQAAPDNPHSFNANTVINGRFTVEGNPAATPIWIGGSRSHTWISSYAYNQLGASCVRLSQLSGKSGINYALRLDLHCEDDSLQNIFEMVGPHPAPQLTSFAFTDAALFAKTYVFKLGKGIDSASIVDLDLRIPLVASSATNVKLLDAPERWTSITGDAYIANPSIWTAPAEFSGRRMLGNQTFSDASVIELDGRTLATKARPQIASGFGTGAAILKANGTAAFTIDVGDGQTASTGTLAMPPASSGWACQANDLTPKSAGRQPGRTELSATTPTSVTLTHYDSAGAPAPWSANGILQMMCLAY